MVDKQTMVFDLLTWAKQVAIFKLNNSIPHEFAEELFSPDSIDDESDNPTVILFRDTDHPQVLNLAEAE